MSKEKSQRVVSAATETEAQKSTFQEQSQGVSVCTPRVEGFHCGSPAGVSLFSSTRNCYVLYILIYFEWDILLQLPCPHLTIVRRMLVQE